MFGNVIVAVVVLFASIGISVNDTDPAWIQGLYDDADGDHLIHFLRTDGHVLTADSAPGKPHMARILVSVNVLTFSSVNPPARRAEFDLGIRGPPGLA